MPANPPPDIDDVVAAVRRSAKYRHISPALIHTAGLRALARGGSIAEAVKETKNTLHQVAGAYLGGRLHYDTWLVELARARQSGSEDQVRSVCRDIMCHHASTRERAGILDIFYSHVLSGLPPIRSIVDVACGFNPLAIPWMSLQAGATYQALDIYADLIDFLNDCFPLLDVRGQAEMVDVTDPSLRVSADLALVLKALPALEQMDKAAGLNLLRRLDTPYMLVSFPMHSLGGRRKGMLSTYDERFTAIARAEGWTFERFVFPTELAFVVHKHALSAGADMSRPAGTLAVTSAEQYGQADSASTASWHISCIVT